MAEVLVAFTEPVRSTDGRHYRARACGGVADDGLWEGWLEFHPAGEGPPLRTPRETEQPNRDDLMYWAQGLSAVYLEGALERARRIAAPRAVDVPIAPTFDRPASATARRSDAPLPERPRRPVLDPYAVLAEGEGVLRAQLLALSRDHLETVVAAYELGDELGDASGLSDVELAERITAAVRRRATMRSADATAERPSAGPPPFA